MIQIRPAVGTPAHALVAGRLDLNGLALGAGDGAKIADETTLAFTALQDAEFLLFDLP